MLKAQPVNLEAHNPLCQVRWLTRTGNMDIWGYKIYSTPSVRHTNTLALQIRDQRCFIRWAAQFKLLSGHAIMLISVNYLKKTQTGPQ